MPDDDLAELGRKRKAAWLAYREATAKVRVAILARFAGLDETAADATEAGIAREAGVTRMTVRKWREKR